MEFNEKLQELRKSKGLTQEELAEVLFVSRTAISKWESGRGYPSIDSLKEISRFFSVTIDDLICSDEMITVAENDKREFVSSFGYPSGDIDVYTRLWQWTGFFRDGISVWIDRDKSMGEDCIYCNHQRCNTERDLRSCYS